MAWLASLALLIGACASDGGDDGPLVGPPAPDPTTRFLEERMASEDPFRVFSMAGGNGQDVKPAMFGLELAAGHHPNDLGRYRELIGMTESTQP